MDFRKLRYFLTVAEEGKVTKAAKRLHMAQPPLSHQIKVFEEELGVQLLEKVGREVRLTKVGQALRERGEQIMDLVDRTEKEIKDLEAGQQGTLSVGCVTALGATLLPDRMLLFNRLHPVIRFQLWEGSAARIVKLLQDGVIEVGVVPSNSDWSDFHSVEMPPEPIVAAIYDEWDKEPSSQSISLDELTTLPFIVPRAANLVLEVMKKRGHNPKIQCVHDDIRSAIALVNGGLGVTLVPKAISAVIPSPRVVYKEIAGPPLAISAVVIWMKNRYISTAARRFLETFQ